jgi:hypothetical protein
MLRRHQGKETHTTALFLWPLFPLLFLHCRIYYCHLDTSLPHGHSKIHNDTCFVVKDANARAVVYSKL